MTDTCCEHCRLKDIFELPEDLMVDWLEKPLLPRYLTASKDVWVTKEGEVIPISYLEDSHLHNIDRMLARIEANMEEVDEETGDPTGADMPGDVREMFDRKQSAIKSEVARRQGHD